MEQAPAGLRGAAADGNGEARTNSRQRLIVDDAIAVQCNSNTMSAVEYLRSRNVGAAVIERVLLEPAKRRAQG